jgi:ribonuclease HI
VKLAALHGVDHLLVKGDSSLAINQVWGDWRLKSISLTPLQEEARQTLKAFITTGGQHILREFNKRADALANDSLDLDQRYQPQYQPVKVHN